MNNYAANNSIDREFAWDDVIENDSVFELIPEGRKRAGLSVYDIRSGARRKAFQNALP